VGTADRRGIKNLDEQDLSLIKRICFQTRMVRLEKKVEGSQVKSLPQMVPVVPRAQ